MMAETESAAQEITNKTYPNHNRYWNALLLSSKHSQYSTDFRVTVTERNGGKVITKETGDDIDNRLLHSYHRSLTL